MTSEHNTSRRHEGAVAIRVDLLRENIAEFLINHSEEKEALQIRQGREMESMVRDLIRRYEELNLPGSLKINQIRVATGDPKQPRVVVFDDGVSKDPASGFSCLFVLNDTGISRFQYVSPEFTNTVKLDCTAVTADLQKYGAWALRAISGLLE